MLGQLNGYWSSTEYTLALLFTAETLAPADAMTMHMNDTKMYLVRIFEARQSVYVWPE